MKQLLLSLTLFTPLTSLAGEKVSLEQSNNALGLDLLRLLDHKKTNLCISPYSIQSALLMTYNGAKSDTKKEMSNVMYFNHEKTNEYNALHKSHAKSITTRLSKKPPEYVESPSIQFNVANRLFGKNDYPFDAKFLEICQNDYSASLKLLDFESTPEESRKFINNWVEQQTEKRIKDLLPQNSITKDTKLVLTNALYLNAPWREAFKKRHTSDEEFILADGTKKKVPTMQQRLGYGYKEAKNYRALTIPYGHYRELEFLIILPNKDTSLDNVLATLTAKELTSLHKLKYKLVSLSLPKFKLSSSTINLKENLTKLGMVTAFDDEKADFSNMLKEGADPEKQLCISDVFHKTFIEIDENGTEAAAATAVTVVPLAACGGESNPVKYIDFTVDRPFFFAIQDAKTGNSLFIGTITDPSK